MSAEGSAAGVDSKNNLHLIAHRPTLEDWAYSETPSGWLGEGSDKGDGNESGSSSGKIQGNIWIRMPAHSHI
jgi:hypothetical protein